MIIMMPPHLECTPDHSKIAKGITEIKNAPKWAMNPKNTHLVNENNQANGVNTGHFS